MHALKIRFQNPSFPFFLSKKTFALSASLLFFHCFQKETYSYTESSYFFNDEFLENLEKFYLLSTQKNIEDLVLQNNDPIENLFLQILKEKKIKRYMRMKSFRRRSFLKKFFKRKLAQRRKFRKKIRAEAEFKRATTAVENINDQTLKNYFLLKSPSLAADLLGHRDHQKKLNQKQINFLLEQTQMLQRENQHLYNQLGATTAPPSPRSNTANNNQNDNQLRRRFAVI